VDDTAIDLDHAATTRLCPEAVAAMEPFGDRRYGNPSGAHRLARDAVRAVDEAREQLAEFCGCEPGELVFTSGGTESDNHAVSGGLPPREGVPVCSAVEHHAVLDPVRALGGRVVGVDRWGRVDLTALAAVLDELGTRVSVVSVMAANNETGVLNDLDAVASTVAEHEPEVPRVPLHTDAVQAAAWCDLTDLVRSADLVSVSAHKLGGPKGVGALVVRGHTPLRPLLHGGGQERGRRSGTTNVAGVVGFAAAAVATAGARERLAVRVGRLRDRLAAGLRERVPGLVETVPDTAGVARLPGILHVCVEGVDAESLLLLLEAGGVYASAASSCASGAWSGSHVLAAMGVDPSLAAGSLRLSLGRDTTAEEVDRALEVIPAAVERVREFAR
jgi:cysteine desulfurase